MLALGADMAADKSKPRDKVAPETGVEPEGDDRDDQEAIRAIRELYGADEATARDMWKRFEEMLTEAANG